MRQLLLVFLVSYALAGHSQTKLNALLLQRLASASNSQQVYPVLIQAEEGFQRRMAALVPGQYQYAVKDIVRATLTASQIKALIAYKEVKRIELQDNHVQMMNDTMVVRNRILPVKQGAAPLAQAYDGSGVVMGIIDSGIDFHHPDFQDNNGKTRIVHLWDQTLTTGGTTPTPFGYGQDWDSTQINAGLCTHDDSPSYGHGTHVAGIAAANGNATGHFQGCAPKADLVVVALDFGNSGPNIADAVQYITTKATQMGKPFVINASVGDYFGSHDGTDLQAQLIDNLIAGIPGRVMVAASGNAGNYKFHVGYNVTPNDTNFTWLYNSNSSLSTVIYSDTAQFRQVKYAVGVDNPNSLNDLGRTGFKDYNYALGTVKKDTIFNNGNRIGIIQTAASVNSFGVYELMIHIQPDSLSYPWRIEATGTGRVDSWNFDYISGGLPPASAYPRIVDYAIPDTSQTLVSSFQCSDEVITVGNYTNLNSYYDYNNTLQHTGEVTGLIQYNSSCGPTRDGRIKPDIAATGANIFSCGVVAQIPMFIASDPTVVAPGGYHVRGGGTSAASPVVAGLAALYLQAYPTSTNQQVKQAIINCPYQDNFTGSNLPNNTYGYGKLDGFHAMTCNLSTGIHLAEKSNGLKLYPMPVTTEAQLQLDRELKQADVRLYDATGKLLLQDKMKGSTYTLSRQNWEAGLYILSIDAPEGHYQTKLIFQ